MGSHLHLFSLDPLTAVLAGVSSLCWLTLYVVACWRGVRERAYFLPVVAVALNIVWEFLFGFVWSPEAPPHDVAQMWVNRAWCLLDVVILATCYLYGPMIVVRHSWRVYTALATAATAATLGSFYYVSSSDPATLVQMQAVSAFVMNVAMSLLFLQSFHSEWVGHSLTIAVAKWVGTAAITVVYFLPTDSPHTSYYPIIWATGVACFFLDGTYTYLTWRATWRGWTRRGLPVRHETSEYPRR